MSEIHKRMCLKFASHLNLPGSLGLSVAVFRSDLWTLLFLPDFELPNFKVAVPIMDSPLNAKENYF